MNFDAAFAPLMVLMAAEHELRCGVRAALPLF
jgi:hypothetical protein